MFNRFIAALPIDLREPFFQGADVDESDTQGEPETLAAPSDPWLFYDPCGFELPKEPAHRRVNAQRNAFRRPVEGA